MDIELCIYYNIMTIWFLFIIQSINLPPSAHTITSSAHCNPLQPTARHPLHHQCTYYSSHCIFSAHTTAYSAYPVHILQQPLHLQCILQPCTAMYNYLQPIFNAHCSHLQPPTLQLYHSVHTVATLSDANTIQCI